MGNEFDFEDTSVADQLVDAGKRLKALSKKPAAGKGGLVKLLKVSSAQQAGRARIFYDVVSTMEDAALHCCMYVSLNATCM